jgi:adenylate cyclase class 2
VKTPIETEIKVRVGREGKAGVAKARALLRRHGFKITAPRVFEQNLVLDDAKGTIRERGMLLRIRAAGSVITCTFKGPETPGRHKRREEREFRASDLESCVTVFAALGFREVFRYEKYRTEFARDDEPGIVTLDETPVGNFMELEGPSRWIDRTAKNLSFPRDAYITDSYGTLYEDWCRLKGIEPGDMRLSALRTRPGKRGW